MSSLRTTTSEQRACTCRSCTTHVDVGLGLLAFSFGTLQRLVAHSEQAPSGDALWLQIVIRREERYYDCFLVNALTKRTHSLLPWLHPLKAGPLQLWCYGSFPLLPTSVEEFSNLVEKLAASSSLQEKASIIDDLKKLLLLPEAHEERARFYMFAPWVITLATRIAAYSPSSTRSKLRTSH
jgi:hypothetical protein